MPVEWTRLALQDMEEIASFIAEENPKAARELVQEIYSAANRLIAQPAIGRPGRVHGTRELFIWGTTYILPYRIADTQIQILRVLHTSRKWPEKGMF